MKILYHHRIGSKDGQAVHVEALIAALREAGHQVQIVAPPSFAKVHFGAQANWLTKVRNGLPLAVSEGLEICYNVPMLWRLWLACKALQPDLIYERYNLFTMAGVLLARLYGIPVFLEVNAPLARERASFGGLSLGRIAARLERYTWRAATLVLPVSQVLADIVRQTGVPSERILVIPNGIDNEMLTCPSSEDAKRKLRLEDKIILGFVGFIREWHGLSTVLRLLAEPQCPDHVHLVIAGDGPALAALKSDAELLGISHRVTFAGLVDRKTLVNYVAAFDIALQPKAVDYASPLKLFEYMAAGKAIVAPDQTNIREILVDGQSASLFRPGDEVEFQRLVLMLVQHKERREHFGKRARSDVLERRYTWSENAHRITDAYAHVTERDGVVRSGRTETVAR